MEDHRSIPEFASPARGRQASLTPAAARSSAPPPIVASRREPPRRFRKGDAVAEIRERNLREFHLIEWSLLLNGQVVTTRQFGVSDRADYDHEIHSVTRDLAGSGWREDEAPAA